MSKFLLFYFSITKSDVLKNIIKRKTKSLGCFEKLLENSLNTNRYKENNLNGLNNINITNGAGNHNSIISYNTNEVNQSITNSNKNLSNKKLPFTNANLNRISVLANKETDDTFQNQDGFNSSRTNYSSSYKINLLNNVNNQSSNKMTSRIMEFSKVIENHSNLSEKEEESHITTQETILQKPKDFLDTSNSYSQKDSSRETINISTNNENYYNNNLLNSYETFNRNSMMISQSSKSKFNIENNNELRMSIQSRQSQQSHSQKMTYNPFIVLKSHLDSVREIYLSPDRKNLISVGEDMLINFWDFKRALKQNKENIEPYMTFRTHTTPIFTLTGPKNLTNNNSNEINFYTSGMDGVIRSCKIPEINIDFHINHSNHSYEEILEKVSPEPWRAHQDMIWDLNYHPSENFMSSVSSDGTVKIFKGMNNTDKSYYSFDSRSKNLIRQLTFKNNYYNFIEIPTASHWSNKNLNFIFVSYISPYVKLFDIESGKSITDYSYNVEKNIPYECQQANKIVYNENLNLVVTGHEDRQLRFFDPNQNKLIKSMVAHTDSVSALSQGLNDYEFLSGSHDGSIRCWDMRINKLLFDIPAHRKKYDEGCLSIKSFPGENFFLSCGADGLIKAFQIN